MHKILWFWDTSRSSNLSQITRPSGCQQKKTTCQIEDIAIPAHHRGKLKVSKKRVKYLDLAREIKKLGNMKMTVIPSVIVVLGTVSKGLVLGQEYFETKGWVETI